MTAFLRYVVDLALGRVPVPVACNGCATSRPYVTHAEAAVLAVHQRLLCACGGELTVAFLGEEVPR